jgi:hypothetical protein
MKPHVWFSRCTQFALLLLPIITVSGQTVADPPPAQSPIRLSAVNDPVTGRTAFSFEGSQEPPVIRAALGDSIRITYMSMAAKSGAILAGEK